MQKSVFWILTYRAESSSFGKMKSFTPQLTKQKKTVMKKFFNFAPAVLVVAVIFSLKSCISDSNLDSGEGVSVSLRIDQSAFETRAVGNEFIAGNPAIFNTGHLCLVTPAGVILERFTIVANGAPPLGTGRVVVGNTINRTDLSHPQGVTIENVSPNLRGGRPILLVILPLPALNKNK